MNTDHVKTAINGCPCGRFFANLGENQKVYLFDETIKDTLSNFIHHKTVIFDVKDSLRVNRKSQEPGIHNEKNAAYRNYLIYDKCSQFFAMFLSFQNQLSLLITDLKDKHYSKIAKS